MFLEKTVKEAIQRAAAENAENNYNGNLSSEKVNGIVTNQSALPGNLVTQNPPPPPSSSSTNGMTSSAPSVVPSSSSNFPLISSSSSSSSVININK